jgi:hypothetical protein
MTHKAGTMSFAANEALVGSTTATISRFGIIGEADVELIRLNDGAARASHETCLRKTSDPSIGSVSWFS